MISSQVRFVDNDYPYHKTVELHDDKTIPPSDINFGGAASGAFVPYDESDVSDNDTLEDAGHTTVASSRADHSSPPSTSVIEIPDDECTPSDCAVDVHGDEEAVGSVVDADVASVPGTEDTDGVPVADAAPVSDATDGATIPDNVESGQDDIDSAMSSAAANAVEHAAPGSFTEIDDLLSDFGDVVPLPSHLDAVLEPVDLQNSDSELLQILPDASSGPDSPPLVRTISEVTDFDGPSAKRVAHYIGSVFQVLKVSRQSYHDGYVPTSYVEAVTCPDSHKWKAAIAKELDAHDLNHTWHFTPLPSKRRAIGCRWVFTIKDNDPSKPPIYKARLVAQGFRQVHGLDYSETFSPVIRYESIRLLFAIAAQFDLAIHQMDVTTAFLNGDLAEEIYMQVPDGVKAASDVVCKLDKSLYGLKQAPLCWNQKINSVLLAAGFTRSISEFGVYSKVVDGHVVLVALYVDDMLILSNSPKLIQATKDMLNSNFKMKDLDVVSTFLGMQVSQSVQGISLNLAKYLSGVLADFGMSDCNSVTTPFASNDVFTPDGSPLSDAEVTQYRSMVGKILFASNTVRPDLAFAASTLSRFIKSPYSNHLASAKHLLRYIKGTLHLGLKFTKQAEFKLVGYCDADWAADKNDRKSITGYVFLLGGTVVTWKSKKQQTVALSSTEAEYMALSDAVKEVLWLKQFLAGIGLKSMSTPMIYEDNEGCKHLAEHPFEHPRTKHIDIRHHFLRDHIANEELKLVSISTDNMMADMLTKNLHRVKFQRFVGMIGMTGV